MARHVEQWLSRGAAVAMVVVGVALSIPAGLICMFTIYAVWISKPPLAERLSGDPSGNLFCGLTLLALVAGVACIVVGRRRLRPKPPGTCSSCGYDRAGLADDAKCPECGTVPAPAPK